jgi:hypothetical protein
VRCSTLVFRSIGNEHYQVEVPVDKKVPSAWQARGGRSAPIVLRLLPPAPALARLTPARPWQMLGHTKTVHRYWTPEIRALQQPLAEARLRKEQAVEALLQTALSRIDEGYAEVGRGRDAAGAVPAGARQADAPAPPRSMGRCTWRSGWAC